MFLIKKDLETYIRLDNLNTIIDSDSRYLNEGILAAQAQVASYLRNYYDETAIFIDVNTFSISDTYAVGDLIVWVGTAYDISATYNTDDYAVYNDYIYKALEDGITGTFDSTKWSQVTQDYSFYTVTTAGSGNYPDNTTYFTAGDSRNAQIKMYVIDLTLYHLHSRINPRNVPQFRADRRDEAITWLKAISKAEITADLPIRSDADDVAARKIIYSSNTKKTWQY